MQIIDFYQTDPSRYRRGGSGRDGDFLLIMDVDQAGGLFDGGLKLNSTISAWISNSTTPCMVTLRYPEVRCVVIKSGKDNMFVPAPISACSANRL